MKHHVHHQQIAPKKRQGRLLAFGVTGALALAVSACGRNDSTMVVPPNSFNPNNAVSYNGTNQPPTNATVYASPGYSGYLGSRGYYPVYGYPNYYYQPAPGSTVQLVSGDASSYRASSPAEARSVARGGFGGSGFGGHGFGGE